jgi:hypothetical protein
MSRPLTDPVNGADGNGADGAASSFGALRLVTGLGLVLAPRLSLRVIVGGHHGRVLVTLARLVGLRDLVIGAGAIRAGRRGANVGPWLRAGAAADGLDAAVAIVAGRRVGRVRRILLAAVATSAASAQAALAGRRVGSPPAG